MNTLDTPQVTGLLGELFRASEITKTELSRQLAALHGAERQRLFDDASHQELYSYARTAHLAISPATGEILYLLARLANARTIVEFGTSFGVSTIYLAAAVKDGGGGMVYGTESEPSKAREARANLASAGLASFCQILEGDAVTTLPANLPAVVDFLFLDGAKPLYATIFRMIEPHLRVGAIVVADNADGSPEYLEVLRRDGRYHSARVGRDVELSIKLES
ncbi:O-methyltransferase [Paraburkholderia sp. J12]|uniref:O-methyltransferase n=1 Tax=Paraburkholderia sp. J12 TaxID=2805432 RepID=UPI002ABD30CA|nr:class I SAM-dependent methyltransferase [Paraburkholderia sp. J12]